ncbi:MAG TPA: hypothetical protein VFT79_03415 [Solirubrobacterales bacterium]|nr:hypothetical protein [Solirubrobacterales bacterium]
MSQPEQYFLLIYDLTSRALQHEEFGCDHTGAAERYSELEELHRENSAIEVVLVGADSFDTIKRTHSHYFVERDEDVFREFLEGATS